MTTSTTRSVRFNTKKCSSCQKQLSQFESVDVLGLSFHPKCFTCSTCSTVLTPETFRQSPEGEFLCPKHFKPPPDTLTRRPSKLFEEETCCICHTRVYIIDRIKVDSKVAHKNCLVCFTCSDALPTNGTFNFRDDKLFCQPHFDIINKQNKHKAQDDLQGKKSQKHQGSNGSCSSSNASSIAVQAPFCTSSSVNDGEETSTAINVESSSIPPDSAPETETLTKDEPDHPHSLHNGIQPTDQDCTISPEASIENASIKDLGHLSADEKQKSSPSDPPAIEEDDIKVDNSIEQEDGIERDDRLGEPENQQLPLPPLIVVEKDSPEQQNSSRLVKGLTRQDEILAEEDLPPIEDPQLPCSADQNDVHTEDVLSSPSPSFLLLKEEVHVRPSEKETPPPRAFSLGNSASLVSLNLDHSSFEMESSQSTPPRSLDTCAVAPSADQPPDTPSKKKRSKSRSKTLEGQSSSSSLSKKKKERSSKKEKGSDKEGKEKTKRPRKEKKEKHKHKEKENKENELVKANEQATEKTKEQENELDKAEELAVSSEKADIQANEKMNELDQANEKMNKLDQANELENEPKKSDEQDNESEKVYEKNNEKVSEQEKATEETDEVPAIDGEAKKSVLPDKEKKPRKSSKSKKRSLERVDSDQKVKQRSDKKKRRTHSRKTVDGALDPLPLLKQTSLPVTTLANSQLDPSSSTPNLAYALSPLPTHQSSKTAPLSPSSSSSSSLSSPSSSSKRSRTKHSSGSSTPKTPKSTATSFLAPPCSRVPYPPRVIPPMPVVGPSNDPVLTEEDHFSNIIPLESSGFAPSDFHFETPQNPELFAINGPAQGLLFYSAKEIEAEGNSIPKPLLVHIGAIHVDSSLIYILQSLIASQSRSIMVKSVLQEESMSLEQNLFSSVTVFSSLVDLLRENDELVILGSGPLKEKALAYCLESERYVLCISPNCGNTSSTQRLYSKLKRSKVYFASHVLLHTPFFWRILDIYNRGDIGYSTSVSVNFQKMSSKKTPSFTELSQELEILFYFLNEICDSFPVKVATFGCRSKLHNLMSVIEYKNGVTLSLAVNYSSVINQQTISIIGSEGVIQADCFKGTIQVESQKSGDADYWEPERGPSFLSLAYQKITQGLIHRIQSNSKNIEVTPKMEKSFIASLTSLSIFDSLIQEGKPINLSPLWLEFSHEIELQSLSTLTSLRVI